MRFDITRLPVGEMLIGFVLVATVLTFVLAFAIAGDEGGGEGPAVSASPEATATTPSGGETPPAGNVIEVAMIPTIKFDKSEVTVPAGQPVTLRADNRDGTIFHNWAAYTDKSAKQLIAGTDICAAPCTKDVTFTAPAPGEYFFRCDVHPTQMTGKLIVQ